MFHTERARRWCKARRTNNWRARITEQGFYGDNYFGDRFRRTREVRFTHLIAGHIVAAWDDLVHLRPPDARRRLLVIGAHTLREAGYSPRRTNPIRKDGRVNKNAAKQVRYLMGMPRVQEGIAAELDAAGCGPSQAYREIAKIATGEPSVATLAPVEKAVRLRALDMVIRLTVGYTKEPRAADVVAPPDAMFIEGEYDETPPMIAAPQEKNITPPMRAKADHRRNRR